MSEPQEIVAGVLLLLAPTVLCGWLLREAVRRWQLHLSPGHVVSDGLNHDPTLTIDNTPPTTNDSVPQPFRPIPRPAILAVACWLSLTFVSGIFANRIEPPEVSLLGIQFGCVMSLMIWGSLAVLLANAGRRPLREFGLFFRGFHWQMVLGWIGFLAAIWPTIILLVLSSAWRTEETQHLYLQALRGPSGGQLLAWIIVSAVLLAPLTEELLFRVTLQGWLGDRLSGPAAIGLTALIFALVHGWRDALPLIPLSLILGYIFHQTRSYWSCVTTHALFNAANIALAIMTISPY